MIIKKLLILLGDISRIPKDNINLLMPGGNKKVTHT